MASRLKLQEFLKTLVDNVYFQPPESVMVKRPCIIYHLSSPDTTHADDGVYSVHKKYTVMLVHTNPDNTIIDELMRLPLCRMQGDPYIKDGLYHYVFELYY